MTMEMYATPKEGTYQHKMPNFDGTFRCQQVKVDVIGESEKQYLIKLLMPVGNHRQNDQMKVRKHNVRLDGMFAVESRQINHDQSRAWWHN